MPKKTKDSSSKIEKIKNLLVPKKSSKTKDTEVKKSKVDDKISPKKVSDKKTSTKTETSSKKSVASQKKTTFKKNTTEKKVTSKAEKTVSSKLAKKAKSIVESTSSKTVSSKSSTSISKKNVTTTSYSPEYYDLPYKYNKTVIKILAQTPTNLFVYWEISDEDRKNLKEKYGDYFFEITKPVLVVHNETMNYSFEIDINDFANSWYIKVNDSNCEYKIELGRRPIPVNYSYMPQYDIKKDGPIKPVNTSYIYISSSNELEAPNDRILFNNQNKIYFRNVKTNQIIEKDIRDFPFIGKGNPFINIYEIYQNLYKEEILNNSFDFTNPSSGNSSSETFSSKFK